MSGTTYLRLALMAAAVSALVACSPASGDDGIATAGGNTAGPATTATVDPETAARQYEQCLRDHGVNLGDAGSTARPQTDAAVLRAALTACHDLASGGDYTQESPVELEARLKTAQCMRDNGYPKWPDPTPGDATVKLPREIDGNSPEVIAALSNCARQFQVIESPSP